MWFLITTILNIQNSYIDYVSRVFCQSNFGSEKIVKVKL